MKDKNKKKRIIGSLAQNDIVQAIVAGTMILGGTIGGYQVVADDLDTNVKIERTADTQQLRQDLNNVRSLATTFEKARDEMRVAADRSGVDQDVVAYLKEEGKHLDLIKAYETTKLDYEQATNSFRTDLVLNKSVNEVTYKQFRDLMPNLSGTTKSNFWLDGDGASLNECRVKYGDNVAAEREDVAKDIASCMKKNDVSAFWALVISLIASGIFGVGSAATMGGSSTMQRWSKLPKPVAADPN